MPRLKAAISAPPARNDTTLRLGFIALNDVAPLAVAQELGFFKKYGLRVELRRELGWATIRDKIAFGEIEAAHAISSLLISSRLGLDTAPADFLTACVLSTGGNAITLSERLWTAGVRDATTLAQEIINTRHDHQLVLGVAAAHSNHYLHLCEWLKTGGINPHRDVRIVVVPPPQVYRNLNAGTIDGYCVGEPWNSLAIQNDIGWCVATSDQLQPDHAEKVLMVRTEFARTRHEEHMLLVAALVEASRKCDEPDFRSDMVKLLTRREYLNQPAKIVGAGLKGPFKLGHGRTVDATDFVRFGRDDLNNPKVERADWLVEGFRSNRLLPASSPQTRNLAREVFRPDIFAQALSRHGLSET
ncbi:CmpA/NrtA family ABC transporter substrate-binding protein [Synoicihabitans lomoniglobus]|uniref:CmpA/NrtA family ABC transporter substrate-binding protein n=1 Tax=Synoicihabitans lomoniglobus TaxID=2909285 RepID=A0AAF0I2W0_9BACT|nr:ABC transporter substrate-binding protein [Opitutaceae bacterium LMO-M01]WED66762.1 CmpA/NrtA family ABC transporter substrate-binding protein [Opitutaceae bacterium LMO-M01]